jgi:tRNA dimethylallyltransferase
MLELKNQPLVAIVGPTGSGKSALALQISQIFDGEIVNFDSVQVYQGLNIGSAKIPPSERRGIPHHLLDILAPADELTAGAYAGLARNCLNELAARRVMPVLVGGTGFYLRSLLNGLSPAAGPNADLRQRLIRLAVRRPGALHRFLRRTNPRAAQRIHPNDHQKLSRAIELAATPPQPREPLTGFRILKIGLNPPRPALYERINLRTAAMFEAGLLEETRALLDSGISSSAKALQSLGYRQAVAVLHGSLSRAEAINDLQLKTRQYAKRQITWFRKEKDIHWLNGFGNHPETERAAIKLVAEFSTFTAHGSAAF